MLAGRRSWFGAAIAASLVLVATFLLWPGARGEALYATAPTLAGHGIDLIGHVPKAALAALVIGIGFTNY